MLIVLAAAVNDRSRTLPGARGLRSPAGFAIQLAQGVLDAVQHGRPLRRQSVDTRLVPTPRLIGPQPTPSRHARQDGIESAGADAIAVAVELFQHPLAVHTPILGGVMQDVDLPERQQELPLDRVTPLRHGPILSRSGWPSASRLLLALCSR